MGKIFDALEKANRKSEKNGFFHKEIKPDEQRNISNEKIVALSDMYKSTDGTHLDESLVTFHTPQSVEAELFKVLRTNLLFPSKGAVPKTILVTSALPGDGKSFVSSNLAISIAQGIEEFVMLVDCDVRKPTIHKIFGKKSGIGLCDFLEMGTELQKILLKTAVKKLSILPAGLSTKNPTELLSSKKMKALLTEIKERYDDRYIIIDSAPPSMASETNVIAKNVDGVLIVVKVGKTPRRAVKETIAQIGKERILGFVLNHAEQNVKKYYGYRKSYYSKTEETELRKTEK